MSKRVLLYSGGMDSFIIDRLWKPDVKLYVDMGTRYSEVEKAMLPEDVVVTSKVDLGQFERPDAIIPMRNLVLVAIASQFGDVIAIGATAGDRVLDKSKTFAELASATLSYLWQPQHWTEGKDVRVVLPYKNSTKAELVEQYLAEGNHPDDLMHKSFSCYDPQQIGHPFEPEYEPCWSCKPCTRKFVALFAAGYRGFDDNAKKKLFEALAPTVLDIQAGRYDRGAKEAHDVISAFSWLTAGLL